MIKGWCILGFKRSDDVRTELYRFNEGSLQTRLQAYERGTCMEQWKILMRATIDAFQSAHYYTALELAEKALNIATLDLNRPCNCDADKKVAAVMVSHFNLADTYVALQQFEEAAHIFEDAREYLTEVISKDQFHDIKKVAALKAGGYLQQEWLLFQKKHQTQLCKNVSQAHLAVSQLH